MHCPKIEHCHEFEQRLNNRLDDRQNPAADPRLAAHAADCEPCRQLLADHTVLLVGLSQANVPALPRSFARRIVAAALPTLTPVGVRRSTGRAWLALGVALASAAAMLLAISLVWYARSREPAVADNSNPAPPHNDHVGSRSPGLAIAQPPTGGRRQAQPHSAAMTSADLLLEAPRLPRRLRAYRIEELAVAFPGTTFRLDEMEHLAPGIRPLRASITTIWDTLFRTIPTWIDDVSPPQHGPTSLWSFAVAHVA